MHATAKKLVGAKYLLDYPSVGATETLMMAAVLAEGETVLANVAQEPEVGNPFFRKRLIGSSAQSLSRQEAVM